MNQIQLELLLVFSVRRQNRIPSALIEHLTMFGFFGVRVAIGLRSRQEKILTVELFLAAILKDQFDRF